MSYEISATTVNLVQYASIFFWYYQFLADDTGNLFKRFRVDLDPIKCLYWYV